MVMALLRLLGPSRFRGPGSFEPIAAGPALHGASMSYPLPSTISGILASYAFQKGLCSPSPGSRSDWVEVERCVEATLRDLGVELGESWALRTGFVVSRNIENRSIYVYLDASSMYVELATLINIVIDAVPKYLNALELYLASKTMEAEKTVDSIEEELRKRLRRGKARRPRFIERIGISLERELKIVRHGYIYSASDLDLHASFRFPREEPLIATEIVNASMTRDIDIIPVRLSEGLPGAIEFSPDSVVSNVEKLTDTSTNCYALFLLTPALLPEGTTTTVYEPLSLTKVMEKLLIGKCKPCLALSEVPYLARSKVIVIVPGYSYAMDRYRSPQPAIVGTTICVAECDWSQAYRVYVEGIGEASRLGWGTLLPIPLPREACKKATEIRKEIQAILG